LAAAELVRVAHTGRRGQADSLEHASDPRLALSRAERGLEDLERLSERRPNRHTRIQTRERILKDDLQIATMPAHRARIAGQKVLPVPNDGATGRRDESQDGARQSGFTGARLTDQTYGLPARDVEAHRIESRVRVEINAELSNLKERLGHGSSG
jgi:hypothetical protein